MTPEISSDVSTKSGAEPQILLRDDLAARELHFVRPDEIVCATSAAEVTGALARIEQAQASGKWCAGYLSYEIGYALEPKLLDHMPDGRHLPLVLMGIFDAPEDRPVSPRQPGKATLSEFQPTWSFEDYVLRFAQVHRTSLCR